LAIEMPVARCVALCFGIAIVASACSDEATKPWNPAEMSALSEKFGHIAEAYAVVDVCIPMIDADKEAKRSVIAKIEIRHYSQLSRMNTEAEIAKFLAFHRQSGGTDEQAATLEQIYRESYRTAAQHLTSVANCAETVSDYSNTILQTRVEASP
jgi:hypothetical protein